MQAGVRWGERGGLSGKGESMQSDSGRGLCAAHSYTGAYNLQCVINHCCVSG